MSFDLSRKTFNALDDYFGVVMQQGRVQLDADWNTMVDQIGRRLQAESLDTFGPAVVPRVTPEGFLITGPASAFEIGPGRIYVDGLLAENHSKALKWDARLAEISGTARLSGADIDAAPSGLTGTTAYNDQPYYPDPPALPAGENLLVYVDVWQRDITHLQDADLVDAAVGVDTTARRQTVWQVRYLDGVGAIDAATADGDIPGWLEAIHPSSARLSTDTGELSDDDDPCLLQPQAGYKGLENQLYRVQVHDGGPLGTATFKWSRDNAIVASRISAMPSGNQIVVESLGRDDVLSFHEGDWVEVTDDHRDLMGLPGEIRRIQLGGGIDTATRTITLEGSPLPIGTDPGEFPIKGTNQTYPERNTRVIRWDQSGLVFREDESEHQNLDAAGSSGVIEIPAAGTRLFLEKGILVDFDLEDVVAEASFDPVFKTGDYWTFAARVNDATVEPLDRAPPSPPFRQAGDHRQRQHHRLPHAVAAGDGRRGLRLHGLRRARGPQQRHRDHPASRRPRGGGRRRHGMPERRPVQHRRHDSNFRQLGHLARPGLADHARRSKSPGTDRNRRRGAGHECHDRQSFRHHDRHQRGPPRGRCEQCVRAGHHPVLPDQLRRRDGLGRQRAPGYEPGREIWRPGGAGEDRGLPDHR
jgi:hypothetical protein